MSPFLTDPEMLYVIDKFGPSNRLPQINNRDAERVLNAGKDDAWLRFEMEL